MSHYKEELDEADRIWDEVSKMNYKQMKADAMAKKKKLDAMNNQGKKLNEVEKVANTQVERLREAQAALKQRKENEFEMMTDGEKDSQLLKNLM